MAEKKYVWHKLADSVVEIAFSSNNLAELTIGGKTICVALNKENLCAFSGKCPHAGGSLSHGYLDAAENIVCPLHRYKFSLKNGRNISGEGYYLKTFPVEIRNDGVFVGFDESNFFSWLK